MPAKKGVNLKTINHKSLLGEGNIDIQGGGSASWEDIKPNLADRTKTDVDINLARNQHLKVGNTEWNKDFEVAGNPATSNTNATIGTTNGNVHIDPSPTDSDGSHGTYFNYYRGEDGTFFGDGKGTGDSTVARIKGDGSALFPIVNIGNKKPSQFGTYNFGAIFEDDSSFTIEAPRASDSSSANPKPVNIKTRGGQWNTLNCGQLSTQGERSDRSAPTTQDIVINGLTNGNTYAQEPGIGFHIPGVTFATLKYHNNNEFHFLNSNQNGYVPIKAENAHLPGGLVTHSGRYNPCAAAFVCTDVTVNGFIRILIPVSIMYSMFSFDVNIYEYYSNDNSIAHLTIGGCTYNDGNLYNTSAIGYSNIGNLEVHFCPSNGSYFSILINKKDTGRDTTWSYPQVSVNNFLSGYSCVPDSPSPIGINFGDVMTSPIATYTVPDLHTKDNMLKWLDLYKLQWTYTGDYYGVCFYINLKELMGSDLNTNTNITLRLSDANNPNTVYSESSIELKWYSQTIVNNAYVVSLGARCNSIAYQSLDPTLIYYSSRFNSSSGTIYGIPMLAVGFYYPTNMKLQLDYIKKNGEIDIMDKVKTLNICNDVNDLPVPIFGIPYGTSSWNYLRSGSETTNWFWRDAL